MAILSLGAVDMAKFGVIVSVAEGRPVEKFTGAQKSSRQEVDIVVDISRGTRAPSSAIGGKMPAVFSVYSVVTQNSHTMREVMYLVLLACLLTGEGALALQPQASTYTQESRTPEIDATTLTSATFSLLNGTILHIAPIAGEPLYKLTNSTRRKLGDFRECSPCTCCDSTRRWCLPTVCCYHINCGVRDLPFGLCSFTPISCSCLGCRE